jgi:hypothetical protein
MRTLTDHIVDGDSANHQLEILAVDEPGQGGANHVYHITYPGGISLDSEGRNVIGVTCHQIQFQNGPIKEFGVNGISHEALLAIIIDRLRSFQAGAFACAENQDALEHTQEALWALQSRTVSRIKRGVEGTHQQ